MTSSEIPAKCQRALDEVQAGQSQRPGRAQVSVTREHTLYRCLVDTDVDINSDTPVPTAFEQQDMSVFARGPGLPELNFQSIMSEKHTRIAEIPAAIFLDNPLLQELLVVHDPYPDPEGNEHPNHVRIICRKGMMVCRAIASAFTQWSFTR